MTILKEPSEQGWQEKLRQQESAAEILDNALHLAGSSDDLEKGLKALFEYLGQMTGSDRAFLFELSESGKTVSNTLEWCREGVRSQQELLQNLPEEETRTWLDILEEKHYFVIDDLEQLRTRDPRIYTCLKPQGIHAGAAARVLRGEKLMGFWGFDNPNPRILPAISSVILDLERIISAQIWQCRIRGQMRNIDLLDPGTGFYNLKALYQHLEHAGSPESMGLIYCRFEENQKSEELLGQLRGMREDLYNLLDTREIYRISPLEFVALYVRVDRERIDRRRRSLKLQIASRHLDLQVGSAWTDTQPMVVDDLIRDAMRWSCFYDGKGQRGREHGDNPLYQYLENNYFDLDFFLDGLIHNNESSCFFFGDLQESVFYLSDNMKRKFGFSGNLVPELMYAWADRIEGQSAKRRYWKDLKQVIDKKLDSCNLYHQVATTGGHREWIHLYGEFKWNEERTDILFCTGRITMQDKNLAVDEATRFSLETVLVRHLAGIRQEGRPCYFIGFSLNSLGKVNDMEGRAYGNSLILSIAEALSDRFCDQLAFYKLSGMRFAALVRPEFESVRVSLIEKLRALIEEKYGAFGIRVPNSCSFVLTKYPQDGLEPLDFVENLTSCIRMVQQEGTGEYMDATAIDIDRVRANANLNLELSRDVLSQMRNFRMVVQPVVETENSRIKGGEALLRWKNQGKDISPAIFIPILEQENMIIQVGRWVFEESVKACRRLLSLYPDFRLSINLSLHQLDDEGLMPFIEQILEKYQVSGSHLILEMTESCMDNAQEKLSQFVLFCTEHGIVVSLDDFGTGYSSIRVLMQYPTTIIKLDRSLLLEMGKSADKKNFISSIVFACHQFGKRVCIEGVETGEQDRMVRDASCDMIQGFYYYRPMELEAVYSLLAQQKQEVQHVQMSYI